jgi:hypothetical protein
MLLRNGDTTPFAVAIVTGKPAPTRPPRDWVIERTVQNVERAMQVECPRDADGNPVGDYQYNGAVANRGLELAARILGMLVVDRSEVTHKKDYEHLSNLELLQLLAKEARELELLEQGKVIDAEALE